ncbi:DUF6959 family protein [Streptomyces afghaniensis]|uniref:DUF6959 family protein n=1 Tax=Streptomyces afghaniensis TaxID=66865 RepID=UPI003F4B0DE0
MSGWMARWSVLRQSCFTDGDYDAVVRLPGRRLPGVLIRGDSLHILRSELAEKVAS